MKKIKKILPISAFSKSVLTVMTGAGLAQGIPILISPLLTRIYSPDEFGAFALFMAIVSIVSVIVTGRYELAIILPKNERDAIHLVALSIGLSLITSLIIFLIILLFNEEITKILKAPEISKWLYWVPFSTLFLGVYTSLNSWGNRSGEYRNLSIGRILQSGSISLTQAIFGNYKNSNVGLMGGQLIGQIIGIIYLARFFYSRNLYLIKSLSFKRAIVLAGRYIKFPKYMIFGQLMNAASGHLPLFMLSALYGPSIAGFYSLSQRVLVAPSVLIGGAIGDVYRTEASKIYRETGECLGLFKKTLLKLTIPSIAFVLPIYFYGDIIYSRIFGAEWRESGEMSSIMAFMIFFQAVSSPLSQTVLFAEKQKLDLVWQLVRLLLSALTLFLGQYLFEDYKISLLYFTIAFSALYLIHTVFQYKVAKGWK